MRYASVFRTGTELVWLFRWGRRVLTGGPEDEYAPLELPAVVVLWGDDGGRGDASEQLVDERHSVRRRE